MNRSLLFLPGNSPSMLMNGLYLPADAIILDLEDAVAPDQKDSARALVKGALENFDYGSREVIVRINDLNTPEWQLDLDAVVCSKIKWIMPAKLSRPDDVLRLDDALSRLEKSRSLPVGKIAILPLVETALAVENAFAIASASPRVKGLFLGGEDLSADLHSPRTLGGQELFYARTRLVTAARASGIDVFDTPFTDTDDLVNLEKDARFAKSLGFSGKAVISPRHLSIVNQVFSPSENEVTWAQDVLAAIEMGKKMGKGAVSLRGKMVDRPIVLRAEQILATAKRIGLKILDATKNIGLKGEQHE